jgi:XRE family transcriptional regulator, stress-response regulator
MVLLRRVIGDALRARRQAQRRTLREVSTAANVSLGYLSEIERGQKEASSELLASICDALGAHLSEVLREVSHTFADAERGAHPAQPPTAQPALAQPALVGTAVAATAVAQPAAAQAAVGQPALAPAAVAAPGAPTVTRRVEGNVSVTVRQETPLRATLRATRRPGTADRGRDGVLSAA